MMETKVKKMTEQVNKLAEQEGNDLEQHFSESSLESYEETGSASSWSSNLRLISKIQYLYKLLCSI